MVLSAKGGEGTLEANVDELFVILFHVSTPLLPNTLVLFLPSTKQERGKRWHCIGSRGTNVHGATMTTKGAGGEATKVRSLFRFLFVDVMFCLITRNVLLYLATGPRALRETTDAGSGA